MKVHARDRNLHGISVSIFGHVMPFHGAPFGRKRAKRFVLEGFSRINPRLTSNDPFVINDVFLTIGINDFPVPQQNTDRARRLVLNADTVNEDPATLLRVAVFRGKAWGRLNHDVVRTIGLHWFEVYPEPIGWYVCQR